MLHIFHIISIFHCYSIFIPHLYRTPVTNPIITLIFLDYISDSDCLLKNENVFHQLERDDLILETGKF